MNKLMFKDFILYNSPCINCKGKINISLTGKRIGITENLFHIKCHVTKDETSVPLRVSYNNALNLKILHKTNKVETNDIGALIKFFSENQLVLTSRCENVSCKSYIQSTELTLDINSFRVSPVYIFTEYVFFADGKNQAIVYTDYSTNKSTITLMLKDKDLFTIDIAAVSVRSFKNKEIFFKKMKTYITFS